MQCEQNLDLMSKITEKKRLKHEQSVEETNDTIKVKTLTPYPFITSSLIGATRKD